MTSAKLIPTLLLAISPFIFFSCSDNSASSSLSTITGKVVDLYGYGVNNVQVSINGSTPAATNANGSFSINKVEIPYDILLFKDSIVTKYIGLTTLSPILRTDVPPIMIHADSYANLTVKHPHVPAGKVLYTGLICNNNPLGFNGVTITDDSTLSSEVGFPSDINNCQASIALLFADTSNLSIQSISNFGAKQFTLSSNSTTTVVFEMSDINLVPPMQVMQVNSPNGAELTAKISFEGSYTRGIKLAYRPMMSSANVFVPINLGIPFNIEWVANYGLKTCDVTLPAGSDPQLSFGNDVNLLLPPNGWSASVFNHTQFTFESGNSGGIYSVFVGDTVFQGRLKVRTFTKNPNFQLPDLSVFGVDYTYGKIYSWNVTNISGYSDLNEYCSWTSFRSFPCRILRATSMNRVFEYAVITPGQK